MSHAIRLSLRRWAGRRLMLISIAWLGATVQAPAQTTYSWNTGDGTWNNSAANWTPAGGPPAAGDSAILGDLPVADDAEVLLGLDPPALDVLEVRGGVQLFTNGFDAESAGLTIQVASRLIVQDGSLFESGAGTVMFPSAVLIVEDGGTFVGGEVTIGSGADVQLTGGRMEIRPGGGGAFLNLPLSGELVGWGTVFLEESTKLDNAGTIRTARPTPDLDDTRYELILDTGVNETSPLLDLDGGSENGTISLAHTTTLTIVGSLSDSFSSTIDLEPDSILDISQPWTLNGGTIELVDAEVTGGLLRNNGGTIRGHGRITSSSLNNFGTIEADGGTLVIDTTNPSQIDGAAPNNGQGVLRAETGDLEIASNITTVFNGLLEVGSTRTFTMSQPSSRFRNAPASEDGDGSGDFGRINLVRGTIEVDTFEQASQLSSIGTSTLNADDILFESGSVTEIVPNRTNVLQLQGETTVEAGATFTGGGTLRNFFGSSLSLLDGAELDAVHLRNDGRLEIGAPVGVANVDSFEQSALLTTRWIVQIGGTSPGTEFDQLIVANDAQLDGILEVELVDLGAGPFAPSLGDTFEILVADNVSGAFADTQLPPLTAGLTWQVAIEPDAVLLTVVDVLEGDYNADGVVNAADYVVWRNNNGQNVTLPGDPTPGSVTQADYDAWVANFGSSLGSGSLSASQAAIPEPASLLLVFLAWSLMETRGHVAGRRYRRVP